MYFCQVRKSSFFCRFGEKFKGEKIDYFFLTHNNATESPLKMMKNVFYFILKAHSVLNIFKFLS